MSEDKQTKTSKNEVSVEEAGPCKKKVSIRIPEESIKEALDEQYDSFRNDVMVPGFRKGRAPRRLIEKRYVKEASEQVKLKLLAEATESAFKDNELEVLGEPDLDYEEIELPESGDMEFDFEVEVHPEFELPALSDIPIKKTKMTVEDEQIDREVEQLRRRAGMWVPKEEGEVEPDDQIIADVSISGEDITEEKLDNVEIFVRKNGFVGAIPVESLDEVVKGAKEGEKREATVDVPKTYFREEYRGKKVNIAIMVKDIKHLKPAELDEGFLERFGVEDENELRERIRDALEGQLEQRSREEMAQQIYDYLLDNTEFELGEDMVGEQASTVLQRQYVGLIKQGLSREDIEERMEQLRAGSEEEAKKQLKQYFVMEKAAKELGVGVDEEEVNGQIAQIAIRRRQRPERMREQMVRDGTISQLKIQVRDDKCINKLLESAEITEVDAEKEKKSGVKRETRAEKSDKKSEKSKKTKKSEKKKSKEKEQ